MATTEHRLALPQGTRVQDFEFHRVLGHGGFGITYLGWNVALDIAVAIKEYLPADLAVRERDMSVLPKSAGDEADFQWGLERFLDEARVMARFKHPNIVQVQHFFQAHGTAYIVMEYVEGETLTEMLNRRGTLTENELTAILLPLLAGLVDVHEAGILHRDVKPGNILLRAADNSPVLVDFGAARQAVGARSRSVTSVLTPGYAPIEQYSSRGHQGPWTDIYALGGVCYQALTGKIPDEAMDRIRSDPLTPVVEAGKGKASAVFLSAIDWALRVEESDRPQRVRQWRAALLGESEIPEPASSSPPEPKARDGKSTSAASKIARWSLALILLTGIGAWWGYQTYPEWFEAVLSRVEWRLDEKQQRRGVAETRQAGQKRQETPAEMPEAIPQGVDAEGTEAALAQADDPSRPNVTPAPPESATASAGPESPPPGPARAPPEEEDEVARLLAAAGADLEARRLTSPAGNNAWDRYRRVLELDPANAEAVKGMERVIEEYMELFTAALEQEDFEKAAGYLAKVGELHPESPVLEEGKQSLVAARQARMERLAEQERQRQAEEAARLAEQERQRAQAVIQEHWATFESALAAGNLDEAANSLEAIRGLDSEDEGLTTAEQRLEAARVERERQRIQAAVREHWVEFEAALAEGGLTAAANALADVRGLDPEDEGLPGGEQQLEQAELERQRRESLAVELAGERVYICESLATIVTKIDTRNRHDLDFFTLPGAICKHEYRDFTCIWQKPRRPEGRGEVFRRYVQTILMPDMRKLSGAIQKCIEQEEIPFTWGRFKKNTFTSGIDKNHFFQRERNADYTLTIGACFEYDDDEIGAGVVLHIDHSAPKGKFYCGW